MQQGNNLPLERKPSWRFTVYFLILNLLVFAEWGEAAAASNTRAVGFNGQLGAATKSSSLTIKECPYQFFLFASPYWQTSGSSFTPFIAGRDLVGEVRVCRFQSCDTNGCGFSYGLENSDGSLRLCYPFSSSMSAVGSESCIPPTPVTPVDSVGPIRLDPPLPVPVRKKRQTDTRSSGQIIPNSSYYCEYEVLYVPRTLSTVWVTQRSFPKFPSLKPEPINLQSNSTKYYLARCKIVLDESFDKSATVRIPGIVFPSSGMNPLNVYYNDVEYTCDQEDLEFPLCLY